jgi:hypothetical protein
MSATVDLRAATMPISIENLSKKARQTEEGRVLGSKLPHASIEFTFDGRQKTICLDDWVNGKGAARDLRLAIDSQTIKPASAKRVLEGWDGTRPLFAAVFAALSGDALESYAAPSSDGAHTFTTKTDIDTRKQSKGFEKALKTALNHMRFVIYIEWRMIQELVKKNAVQNAS